MALDFKKMEETLTEVLANETKENVLAWLDKKRGEISEVGLNAVVLPTVAEIGKWYEPDNIIPKTITQKVKICYEDSAISTTTTEGFYDKNTKRWFKLLPSCYLMQVETKKIRKWSPMQTT